MFCKSSLKWASEELHFYFAKKRVVFLCKYSWEPSSQIPCPLWKQYRGSKKSCSPFCPCITLSLFGNFYLINTSVNYILLSKEGLPRSLCLEPHLDDMIFIAKPAVTKIFYIGYLTDFSRLFLAGRIIRLTVSSDNF